MNRFSYLLVLSFTQLVWSQLRGTPIGSAEAKTRSHGNERGSNERRLDPDEWVQQVAQSRIGIKRLLAVRVSSSVAGEYPSETLDEMEGAIFGSGPNPLHVPSQSTLTAQFRAVSHDQLIYEPAVFPNLTRAGLLEINIDRSMMMDDSDNTTEHFSVTVEPAIMAKAETVLGRPLWEIADRVMFCLPSGSLISTAAAISTVGGMVRAVSVPIVCFFCVCLHWSRSIILVVCSCLVSPFFCSSRITNIQAVQIFMS